MLPELEPSFYGFSDADMDIVFNISNTYLQASYSGVWIYDNPNDLSQKHIINGLFIFVADISPEHHK